MWLEIIFRIVLIWKFGERREENCKGDLKVESSDIEGKLKYFGVLEFK